MIIKKISAFLLNHFYGLIFEYKQQAKLHLKVKNIETYKAALQDRTEKLYTIDFIEGYSILARGRDLCGVTEVFLFEDYTQNIKIKPGMVVYDLGSCIGDFAILAAFQGAQVIAIEPDKTNFDILVRNISLNNLADKITPLNIAIDSKAGTSGFNNSAQNSGGYTLEESGLIQVETKTLSEVMLAQQHSTIDVLKIDVEGSEYKIFSDPVAANLNHIHTIVGEYHLNIHKDTYSWVNLQSLLKNHYSHITRRPPYYFEARK